MLNAWGEELGLPLRNNTDDQCRVSTLADSPSAHPRSPGRPPPLAEGTNHPDHLYDRTELRLPPPKHKAVTALPIHRGLHPLATGLSQPAAPLSLPSTPPPSPPAPADHRPGIPPPRLAAASPYLPLVEERLLGLGGLDGLVRLPLLQQVLRHQRDPPPRPAGREKPVTPDSTAPHPDPPDLPAASRSPATAQCPRMAADARTPPAPLTPPPPSCRGAAAARAPGGGGVMAARAEGRLLPARLRSPSSFASQPAARGGVCPGRGGTALLSVRRRRKRKKNNNIKKQRVCR